MPTILHNGARLAYEETGAGGPPFLFIHGWTCDRSFFAPQAEYFARNHRVVSVDLRGHGESDKPRGEYSVESYADDIAHVIEQLGLGRVVAVGHSLGATIVLQLAAAHPGRVAGIVMVDPPPFVLPPDLRAGFEAMAAAIEAGNREPQRQFITGRLFLPSSDPGLIERIVDVMLAGPDYVAASSLRGLAAFDGAAAAAQCKVPALHLTAAAAWNPPHVMSQWLPGVVNGLAVGGGHFSQLEVPDQVNGMIAAFVRHYVSNLAAV
jgi:pimeloyl-ACP methyl ester carboxylesterase